MPSHLTGISTGKGFFLFRLISIEYLGRNKEKNVDRTEQTH